MDQQEVFKAWGESLKGLIIERQKSRGIRASGRSAESLRLELSAKGFKLWGASYFFFQEYGRGPSSSGSGKGQGPSLRVRIRHWIDEKRIQPIDITKDSLAYIISRKIHEEGTLLFKGQAQKVGIEQSIQESIKQFKPQVKERALLDLRSDIIKRFRNAAIS